MTHEIILAGFGGREYYQPEGFDPGRHDGWKTGFLASILWPGDARRHSEQQCCHFRQTG